MKSHIERFFQPLNAVEEDFESAEERAFSDHADLSHSEFDRLPAKGAVDGGSRWRSNHANGGSRNRRCQSHAKTSFTYSDVEHVRESGCWDNPCMDIAPTIITLTPDFEGRYLVIENLQGRPYFAAFNGCPVDVGDFLNPDNSTTRDAIRIVYCPLGSFPHYNPILNGNRTEVPGDGDCFFRSVSSALTGQIASDGAVRSLRSRTADQFENILDLATEERLMSMHSPKDFGPVFDNSSLYHPFHLIRSGEYKNYIDVSGAFVLPSRSVNRGRRNAVSRAMHFMLLLSQVQPSNQTQTIAETPETQHISKRYQPVRDRHTSFVHKDKWNSLKTSAIEKKSRMAGSPKPISSVNQYQAENLVFKPDSMDMSAPSSSAVPEQVPMLTATAVSSTIPYYYARLTRNTLRATVSSFAIGLLWFLSGVLRNGFSSGKTDSIKINKEVTGSGRPYAEPWLANNPANQWEVFLSQQPETTRDYLRDAMPLSVAGQKKSIAFSYYLLAADNLLMRQLQQKFLTLPVATQIQFWETRDNLLNEICNSTHHTAEQFKKTLQDRAIYEADIEKAYQLYVNFANNDTILATEGMRTAAGMELSSHSNDAPSNQTSNVHASSWEMQKVANNGNDLKSPLLADPMLTQTPQVTMMFNVAKRTLSRLPTVDLRSPANVKREENRINRQHYHASSYQAYVPGSSAGGVFDEILNHRGSKRQEADRNAKYKSSKYIKKLYAADLQRLHRSEQYSFTKEKQRVVETLERYKTIGKNLNDDLTLSRLQAILVLKTISAPTDILNRSSAQQAIEARSSELSSEAEILYQNGDEQTRNDLYRLECICYCNNKEQKEAQQDHISTFWQARHLYEKDLSIRNREFRKFDNYTKIGELKNSFQFDTLREYYDHFDEVRGEMADFGKYLASKNIYSNAKSPNVMESKTNPEEILWISMGYRDRPISGTLGLVKLPSGKIFTCSTLDLNVVAVDVTERVSPIFSQLKRLGAAAGANNKIEMANDFMSPRAIGEILLGTELPSVFANSTLKSTPGTLGKFLSEYWYVNGRTSSIKTKGIRDIHDLISKSLTHELTKIIDAKEELNRDRHWYEEVLRSLPFFEMFENLHAGRPERIKSLDVLWDMYSLVTSLLAFGVQLSRLSKLTATAMRNVERRAVQKAISTKSFPGFLAQELKREMTTGQFLKQVSKVNLEVAEFLYPPVSMVRPFYAAGRWGNRLAKELKTRKMLSPGILSGALENHSQRALHRSKVAKATINHKKFKSKMCKGKRAVDADGCFQPPGVIMKKPQNRRPGGDQLNPISNEVIFSAGFSVSKLETQLVSTFGKYLKPDEPLHLDVRISSAEDVSRIAHNNFLAGSPQSQADETEAQFSQFLSDPGSRPIAVTEMTGDNRGRVHLSKDAEEFYTDSNNFDTEKIQFTVIHESVHSIAYKNDGGFDNAKMMRIFGRQPAPHENIDEIFTDYFAREIANGLGIKDENINTGYFAVFNNLDSNKDAFEGGRVWYGSFAELIKDKLTARGMTSTWDELTAAFFCGDVKPFELLFAHTLPELITDWKKYATTLQVKTKKGKGPFPKPEKDAKGRIIKSLFNVRVIP